MNKKSAKTFKNFANVAAKNNNYKTFYTKKSQLEHPKTSDPMLRPMSLANLTLACPEPTAAANLDKTVEAHKLHIYIDCKSDNLNTYQTSLQFLDVSISVSNLRKKQTFKVRTKTHNPERF